MPADRDIAAIEFRAGNKSITHHAMRSAPAVQAGTHQRAIEIEFKGIHRQLQRLGIEAAKAFIDKQRLNLQRTRRHRRQAQGQGRKVAVISHVQEMHERIPVQIRVQRRGNGLSTLEVK